MLYNRDVENQIKVYHFQLALAYFIMTHVICYWFLDPSYIYVWYVIVFGTIIFLFLFRWLTVKNVYSTGYYYNYTPKLWRLAWLTTASTSIFFLIHYFIHYPIISQQFISVEAEFSSVTSYTLETGDIYYSFKFKVNLSEILQDQGYNQYTLQQKYPNEDLNQKIFACGCGIQYGPWGDTIGNPSKPYLYYQSEFGVPGIKLPSWLCLCFSDSACQGKYSINSTINQILYYRIVGDLDIALNNTKCPPNDNNFIQVYREPNGNVSLASIICNFLFGFTLFSASASHFIAMMYIYCIRNYGLRLSLLILAAAGTVGFEILFILDEVFTRDSYYFIGFLTTSALNGYIYIWYMKDDVYLLYTNLMADYQNISKEYTHIHVRIDNESKIKTNYYNIIKKGKLLIVLIIKIFTLLIHLTIYMWCRGRLKLFALRKFNITKEDYENKINDKAQLNDNLRLNLITIFEILILRNIQLGLMIYMLYLNEISNLYLLQITFIFLGYEYISTIYPLFRQLFVIKNPCIVLYCLNQRYYNTEVVRKERELKKYDAQIYNLQNELYKRSLYF